MNYSSVIELEKKLLEVATRENISELNLILSDEFFEIGTSGKVYDKNLILERLPKESPRNIQAIDFKVIELAHNVVQLRFKTIEENNESTSIESSRSSIWKYTDNRWQVIFHQGTRVYT